jgi:hypothetical protein
MRDRNWHMLQVVVLGLAGCAGPRPPPPVLVAKVAASPSVVIAVRRLAPVRLRGDVLLALNGTIAPAPADAGYELVIQAGDGRMVDCVVHMSRAPSVGRPIAPSPCSAQGAAR